MRESSSERGLTARAVFGIFGAAVLCFLGGGASARAEEAEDVERGRDVLEVDAGEREVLPVVLLSPFQEAGELRSSEIIDVVAGSIQKRALYALVVVDDGLLLSCEGRLLCVLRGLDGEAKRVIRGTMLPATRAVIIERLAGEGEDLIGLAVHDLAAATSSLAGAERREGSDVELARRATLYRSPRLSVSSVDELRLRVEALWEDPEPSRALGRVLPGVGGLRVEGVPEGGALLVEGRSMVPVASGAPIRIRNLRPGPRHIALRDARYYPLEATALIAPKGEAVIDFHPAPIPHPLRAPAMWTQAAMIGAGSVLLAIGLIDAATTARPACVSNRSDPEEQTPCAVRFARFGDEDGVAREGGVPPAPLGYSLMIGGAAGYLLTRLWLREYESPWLALLVSGVAASASMTLSLVLEP
ncbi:MAG: hypothetical protein IT384_13095 [Deltaproteobacteria bacterium]|nr:hypothetical protein [Deltaproteobacteria bacterium]